MITVEWYLPLTFEVLHDVQEQVVYVWLVLELVLDLVQVRQRVLDV